MEKKVLFITTRIPFPTTSGRKSSLYHYCRLIKQNGYKVIVASFDDGTDLSLKPDFIDEIIVLPNPNKLSKIFNVLIKSLILKRIPMQVALYYNKKIEKIINIIIKKENPSIVIADMVRTTEYIKKLSGIKTIADLDDRLSLRYQRQLECDINNVNPYGLFLNSLPSFLKKVAMNNRVKTIVMKNEIKLLKNYELEVGRNTDYTVFVAKNETEEYNKELGLTKALTIPIGVDVDYFQNQKNITKNKDLYIGFLGVLNVAHNENAIKRFINSIFPIILKKCPNAKFLIIGGGANEELKKFQSDSIIFTGRVDDVRDYLRKCRVFVCPLSFGSGIKTKNLEAMSLGIPVVTTSIGAENISAKNSVDWYVEDDDAKFADRVSQLLIDENIAYLMGNSGSKYVRNNFTWDIADKELKKILK